MATSIVIMIGRSRRTAPSTAASTTESPRARNWLMYSTMITPICTETPNRARKPMPEETLKWVPVNSSAKQPADRRHDHVHQNQAGPLDDWNMRVEDHEDQQDRDRDDDRQARLATLLAFVLAGPVDACSPAGSLTCSFTLAIASSTVLPRSRPRTLYLMAM